MLEEAVRNYRVPNKLISDLFTISVLLKITELYNRIVHAFMHRMCCGIESLFVVTLTSTLAHFASFGPQNYTLLHTYLSQFVPES